MAWAGSSGAVSDRPTGPFTDAIGKALIVNEMTTDKKHSWDDIDPTVFIDDDQQAYLFRGHASCKWVKLKFNMIELDGPVTAFKPLHYIEGPWGYRGIIQENVPNSFTTPWYY